MMLSKKFPVGSLVRCTTDRRMYRVLQTLGEVSVEVVREGYTGEHKLIHFTKLEAL